MRETATKLLANSYPVLVDKFAQSITDVEDFRGDICLNIRRERLTQIVEFLKNDQDHRFVLMIDLFAMDYAKYEPAPPERFAVIYILYSLHRKEHIRIKAFVPEDDAKIESIHKIYKAANWFEREAWDLFGVEFEGHPNLVRILCHVDFEGHPLRKDYPADRYQRLKNAASSEQF